MIKKNKVPKCWFSTLVLFYILNKIIEIKKSIQLTSQFIDELIFEGRNLEIGNVIEFWEEELEHKL